MTTATTASVTATTRPRFRGFAASLLLSSVLAGAAVALGDVPVTVRAAAAILTAGVCVAGWDVATGRRAQRFRWLVLLAAVVLVVFVPSMWESSPRSPRSLHVAAALSYGAVAVAAVLATIPRIGEGKALLLTFSTAMALFGAEVLVSPPAPVVLASWNLNTIEDPDVELRYTPNSTARMFYPDNPRGYFEQAHPTLQDTWSLELHAGSEAQLEHLPSEPGSMRVKIAKRVGDAQWNVSLQQTGFQITEGQSYILKFRARADAAKRISCQVGLNRLPWTLLGVYAEVAVQTEWKAFQCPFVATDSESGARIYFNLATSDAAVELSGVVLHNQSAGKDEAPSLPPTHYFVEYRFNSLGFRGPDPAVPRPPGTYRILAIGDSYTQGVGVHEQDTFEVRLQERLNHAEAGRGGTMVYEVINAGVSGYATRQELRSYEKFSSTYEPQVVLLVMTSNDDMSFQEEVRRGLVSASGNPGGLTSLWNRAQRTVRTYDYSDTALALKQLHEATRQRGAKLAVVIFTNVRDLEPWATLAAAVTKALEGTGVPMLNLEDALFGEGLEEKELMVHAIDSHPNEIAHRIAAEEIERFLRTEHLLP